MPHDSELDDASLDDLLAQFSRQLDTRSERSLALLNALAHRALPSSHRDPLDESTRATILAQYARCGGDHPYRAHLLRLLSADATEESLTALVDQILDDPPQAGDAAVLALVPLFQREAWPIESVFPRLLDALDQQALAAVILDLANFLTRQGRVLMHPATARVDQLATLLGNLAQALGQLEENPRRFAVSAGELSRRVSEALALVMALCDALALIGDPQVCGKLYQVRDLRHRQLRAEASAALARLGDTSGIDTLVELAGEPVVRSRVLAYLDELAATERVAEEHRSPEARAAGTLAAWIAQPLRFGIAPQSLELVDTTRQFWPGYEEPVTCYLFDCQLLPSDDSSVIGIVGPLTAAASVDLADLPPADIYAFYAAQCIEHEAIDYRATPQLTPDELAAWTALKPALIEAGFEQLQLHGYGRFFEYQQWVATARRDGREGVLVVGEATPGWYPLIAGKRALGIDDWLAVHRGRIVLRTFNG